MFVLKLSFQQGLCARLLVNRVTPLTSLNQVDDTLLLLTLRDGSGSPNRHLHWHLIHALHYHRWRRCLQMICPMDEHHHSHPIVGFALIQAGDVFEHG